MLTAARTKTLVQIKPLSRKRVEAPQQITQTQTQTQKDKKLAFTDGRSLAKRAAPRLGETGLLQRVNKGKLMGVLDKENLSPTPDPAVAYDASLSPKKALRIANLKKRFSSTILKAQRGTLYGLDSGVSSSLPQTVVHAELKTPNVGDREAARIALQKMEETAYLDDSTHFLKQLALMTGCSEYDSFFSSGCSRSFQGSRPQNPLQQFDLYLKDDYTVDVAHDGCLNDISDSDTQANLKIKIDRQREAARIALERMEQTTEIEDNFQILKELAIMSGCSECGPIFSCGIGAFHSNPLKQFGLHLKDVDPDGNYTTVFYEELEEGEISEELEEGEITGS